MDLHGHAASPPSASTTTSATVTGNYPPTGQTVTDNNPDHYLGVAPAINIVKKTNGTANACPPSPIVPAGSTVTWTYDVTNPDTFPISNVVVRDDAGTPGVPGDDFSATFVGGDTNNDGKLDPGETWTFTASGTAHAGQYNNIATVNGDSVASGVTVPVSATDDDCYTGADDVVTTAVRDAAGHDVTNTTVPAGTVVHDEATVAKTASTPASAPAPSGTVSFTLYDNGTCNGTVVATDPNKPLSGGIATSANFTPPAAGGTFSYLAHYNGDANYPARNGPCEPFTVEKPPAGQITPTQVDCADFVAGAPTLGQINYSVSGGKIGQNINPGVFFFWTTITTTVPNQVVTVSQTNTSTNNAALFTVHQGWDRLYKGDCSSYKTGTEIAGGSGASFTVAAPGTYHIGIKYSTKSIAGTTAPVPADITYNFSTSLGGNTGASVLLKKQ